MDFQYTVEQSTGGARDLHAQREHPAGRSPGIPDGVRRNRSSKAATVVDETRESRYVENAAAELTWHHALCVQDRKRSPAASGHSVYVRLPRPGQKHDKKNRKA